MIAVGRANIMSFMSFCVHVQILPKTAVCESRWPQSMVPCGAVQFCKRKLELLAMSAMRSSDGWSPAKVLRFYLSRLQKSQ